MTDRLVERRKKRGRDKIRGTNNRPRLSVFRSNKYIYAQIISDEKGETLVEASEKEVKNTAAKKTSKIERAKEVGEVLAQKAQGKKIKAVSFDRGGYKYQGRVKALAEGAREKGLKF